MDLTAKRQEAIVNSLIGHLDQAQLIASHSGRTQNLMSILKPGDGVVFGSIDAMHLFNEEYEEFLKRKDTPHHEPQQITVFRLDASGEKLFSSNPKKIRVKGKIYIDASWYDLHSFAVLCELLQAPDAIRTKLSEEAFEQFLETGVMGQNQLETELIKTLRHVRHWFDHLENVQGRKGSCKPVIEKIDNTLRKVGV